VGGEGDPRPTGLLIQPPLGYVEGAVDDLVRSLLTFGFAFLLFLDQSTSAMLNSLPLMTTVACGMAIFTFDSLSNSSCGMKLLCFNWS
jgi:hypothetical protein